MPTEPKGLTVPPMPHVVMHIATPTLPSLHEMASADLFIVSARRAVSHSHSPGPMPCVY
jgi:hypothetical protein